MYAQKTAAFLTRSRFPLGIIAALLFCFDKFTMGLDIYALALFTDVADGYIARHYNCTSDWGREWDRRADMFMNTAVLIGYVAGAYFVWGSLWWALGPFLAAGGLMAATIPFFGRHSAASKLRSGAIRLLLLGFIAARLKWNFYDFSIALCLISFGIPAIVHEISLTIDEVRTGKRRWFKSPLPRP